MTAEEHFEKWYLKTYTIEHYRALEEFYSLDFDFQLGVEMAYLRSLGYNYFNLTNAYPQLFECTAIVILKEGRILGKGKTPEQAWQNLFNEVQKKEHGQ